MKLYIGSLSWGIDDHGLREAFEPFGEIEYAKVITDRETGRSRGFGFVTFYEANDAKAAMDEMNGKELDGRQVRISEAIEREPRRNQNRY